MTSAILTSLGVYTLGAVAGVFLLWILYLAVMNLARAKIAGQLVGKALALGSVVLVLGYAMDFLVNVLVLTVLMLEFPQESTVTARLKRHKADFQPMPVTRLWRWRQAVVAWFEPLLDPFDPSGDHV